MSIAIKSGAKVLYQWERGVALTASTPCDILRISREDDRVTDDLYPVISGSTGTALIPDRMLTESGYLHVSRIDISDGSERVLETVRILVRHAAKPQSTSSSTKEIADMQVLRMQMAALERAAREGKFDGKDGITPHVGENGNWYLGDTDTGVQARGEDGITPHIGENGNWYLGDLDTGVKARGEDGITPHIGENGNWYLGETDTGVKATGDDGFTPHIGENGNWFVGDNDTGIKASGIHIGTEAPTNGETVWIDTDEEPEENDGTQIDVIAQPGQIIAVKEVDANGKPTKWEAIDLPEAKEPETPDFSANEGDAGYIKNRTHYVDKKGVIHKLQNMYIDAEWMATKEDGGTGQTVFIPEQTLSSGMWSNLQQDLIEGDAYAVEVNGLTYKCVCQNNGSMLYLGNGTLFGATEHNNEPFCISWVSGATGGLFYRNDNLSYPIGIKVSDWLDEIYNKLPKEFMPDISFEELTEKPFVEGMGELLYSQTVTFDTDNDSVKLAKISLTPKLDVVYWMDINGVLHKCHWEKSGVSYDLYDTEGNKWMQKNTLATYLYGQTAGTYAYNLYESSEIQMLDPKYIPANVAKKSDIPTGGGTGGTSIDVTAEVGQTIVVKEIDENGKPTKWEAADYQPRTHWDERIELIPETLLEETDVIEIEPVWFEAGKKYTVVYNGTEYIREAVDFSDEVGYPFVYLGDIGINDESVTGEPFLVITYNDPEYGEFTELITQAGVLNSTIAVLQGEVVQIPKKYISEYLPFRFECFSEDGGFYTNITVSELELEIEKGRQIISVFHAGLGVDFHLPFAGFYGANSYGKVIMFVAGTTELTLTPTENGTYDVGAKQ